MKWYLKVLKNYATFSGRARRSEFWFFFLFNKIFVFVAICIAAILAFTLDSSHVLDIFGFTYIILAIYALAVFIPFLAVTVRRLHDVGKSGWMFFIVLLPIFGQIWLLVLLFTDSQTGRNKWGENPKGEL